MKIVTLIPAYNPGVALLELVHELKQRGVGDIIIVDDGSKESCASIFGEIKKQDGVHVLRHEVNLGKGRSLKTGINYFLQKFPNHTGIVTADADGQHVVDDIIKVAQGLEKSPNSVVLGVRRFLKGVPLRSLLGNLLTVYVYYFLVGKKISDTQTGLRGLPRLHLPLFLKLSGEGYEYEMNVLVNCKVHGISIIEESIQTVYIDSNRSSHFSPFFDSMKIYFLLLRFTFSSIASSLVDFVIFAFVYNIIVDNILYSLIAARIVASLFNFFVNQRFVFLSKQSRWLVMAKYYALAVLILLFAYVMIKEMVAQLLIPVLIAKVLTESILFLVSFTIQRDYIFNNESDPT